MVCRLYFLAMNRLTLFIVIALAFVGCKSEEPRQKFLLGGSGWDHLAIIDKDSHQVEWSYQLDEYENDYIECNSVDMTSDGKSIFFAYKHGVKLIDRETKETIWDYPTQEGEEAHSAMIEGDDTFIAAFCGSPVRILEFNKSGDISWELSFDAEIDNPHSQFRQIMKTSKGEYIVPLFARGLICKLSSQGELLDSVKGVGVPFSLMEQPSGSWIVATGDSHTFVEMDSASGEVLKTHSNSMFTFVADISSTGDGGLYICNWVGHSKEKDQPKIIELDSSNKVVWTLPGDVEGIGMVSTLHAFKE